MSRGQRFQPKWVSSLGPALLSLLRLLRLALPAKVPVPHSPEAGPGEQRHDHEDDEEVLQPVRARILPPIAAAERP